MKSELSKSPLVSVCIACFSPGEVFVATLRSVLDQTYTNLEILIWDNAPNGEIETIIQSFSDPRVRYFVSSENKGPYGGLNELLDRAKWEYIAIQDHDDFWHTEKIERQVELLDTHANLIACGTKSIMYYEWDQFYFEYLIGRGKGYVIHPSLMFRRTDARYPEEIAYMTDAFFQKNILTQSSNQIQEIEEALTFHRIRKGAENYSYRWFQFTQNTISQVYKTHAFRYATCVIGWECMRKVVYPFLSLIGRQDSIDSLERIPFWLMGKKAQKSTGSEWCSSLLKE